MWLLLCVSEDAFEVLKLCMSSMLFFFVAIDVDVVVSMCVCTS